MNSQKVSHYDILEKLHESDLGVIYRATDTVLKRDVAIKFLPQEVNNSIEDRPFFMREIQTTSLLDHRNICSVYEVDETEDGQLFMAMEYYEGENLRSIIESNEGGLPLAEAKDIVKQIAEGLIYAHKRRIVHRNIKPEHIIYTKNQQVIVIDFRLAKVSGRFQIASTGTMLGTPAYMAPEQVMGLNVDPRADIWSCGVLLYKMLTGQVPFGGRNITEVTYSILHDELKPLTKFAPSVPGELESIVRKAITKKADERYQSMKAMMRDLKKLNGGSEPPKRDDPSQPSWFARLRRSGYETKKGGN